ncbi:hypothetical protein BDZ94DRAFT_1254366 [Collybia nuda]|uniref:Uncharacterized protein n=1 Tax=Collybia nuda TaxID=64659 RepID=A0A9P5Y8L6_9AGAR|nr:hypothetical protein BDZ94DRAFT_1254366 [Collybia nuda]
MKQEPQSSSLRPFEYLGLYGISPSRFAPILAWRIHIVRERRGRFVTAKIMEKLVKNTTNNIYHAKRLISTRVLQNLITVDPAPL